MKVNLLNSEKTFNDHFSSLNVHSCDNLSKLKGPDLKEIINELLKTELVYRETLGLNPNLTFGLEIEYQNALKKSIEEELRKFLVLKRYSVECWDSKYDSTVMDMGVYGGEITTPIMRDKKENWETIAKVFEVLRKHKALTENKTGGHIHYGAKIFENNISYFKNLLYFWIISEKIIFRFSYGDRLGARTGIINHAMPFANILYNRLDSLKNAEDIKQMIKNLIGNKYQAINLSNLIQDDMPWKRTIEIRCPNGTLNEIVSQNNVNFFGKLLEYCKSSSFDQDYIERKLREYKSEEYDFSLYSEIYLQEALELSDLIFKNNLDKLYFLKQYLKGFKFQEYIADNMKLIKL